MNLFIKVLLVSVLFGSCSPLDRDIDIEGKWKSVFISPDFQSESAVYFKDFDLYENSKFEPIIFISADSLRYDLGFGRKNMLFHENYTNVIVENEQLKIRSGKNNEVFNISYPTKNEFCLSKHKKKVACFTKLVNSLNINCESYAVDLRVKSDDYDILLELSPLEGQIVRRGLKSDTTSFAVNEFDRKYISRLIGLINDETFNPQTKITGGDYSEYEIKLKCGNRSHEGKSLGLRDISFELRSLLTNLENYINIKFRK